MRHCPSCSRMKELATTNVNQLIDEQLSLELNLATEEIVEKRLSVCLNCPFLKEQTCLKCGCYARFRANLKNKTCPINKWSV